MRVFPLIVIRALALLALAFAPAAWADYYVVVSDRNPISTLSQKEALHLFMGRNRTFVHGGVAARFDMADDAARAGFYRALGGMSLAQMTSYWARLMFSGRSLPPQQIESPAEMMERVRDNPLAIGWLASPPTGRGLRTVLVLRRAS
jgi:hypothetical protein